MRTLGTYDDLADAIAAIFEVAPSAYELPTMSSLLDRSVARAFLSPSSGKVYLAMHGDAVGAEPADLDEMDVPEFLGLATIASEVDNALAALANPGQPFDLEDWHEELLDEASDAQVVYEQIRAAASAGLLAPINPDEVAAQVDRSLIFQMDQVRRELTRLALARVAHMQHLLDVRDNRHGAKTEIARLLKLPQQSVQDALTANTQRWTKARADQAARS
jgi:hypothetical protein